MAVFPKLLYRHSLSNGGSSDTEITCQLARNRVAGFAKMQIELSGPF